jgi:hypothetical protein
VKKRWMGGAEGRREGRGKAAPWSGANSGQMKGGIRRQERSGQMKRVATSSGDGKEGGCSCCPRQSSSSGPRQGQSSSTGPRQGGGFRPRKSRSGSRSGGSKEIGPGRGGEGREHGEVGRGRWRAAGHGPLAAEEAGGCRGGRRLRREEEGWIPCLGKVILLIRANPRRVAI